MTSMVMAENRERNITNAFGQYGQRLFRFIRGRVATNADAEDIAQEVWYQFSRLVDVDSIEQVSAWLFRVARNRVTDNYRRKKTDSIEDFSYEDEDGETVVNESLLADFAPPEDDDLKELFWETLLQALEELPENQRQVFIWNEMEDQTFQDISDRTGINIKTLISRKRYAVQHLRKRLQNIYEEFLND